MISEIVEGLRRPQKMIAPKYFYDERGSELFEEITRLPEYYPTQTELGIMRRHAGEIADLIGSQASLIEFGSGSSLKTRTLLEHLHELAAYVPVDISEDHLQESAQAVQREFPETEVLPTVADFTRPFDLPEPVVEPLRNLVYFPGSTIGNFTRDAAVDLLKVIHQIAGEHGALLIGADLQKDPETIERAYNDSAGVTAEFNLNVLSHINNVYDGDFDASRFRHRADYNRDEGRIEMYLVSTAEQEVGIAGEIVAIEKGEAILTEYSHKYTLEGFAGMAAEAGFEVDHVWMDDERLFSVQYLTRS